ncbi:hypothetical protein LCGC14_2534190 [marine sediment metagenome]|uniref:Uncharacterized protein n=1 Tax=marine sediment metagenome TaxID=412755 RepID=A0A0F9ASL4_9ZZZZ
MKRATRPRLSLDTLNRTVENPTWYTSPTILACDPSYTAWGWAAVEGHQVKSAGVIVTQPEAKKRRIREGDDFVRRTNNIIKELKQIIDKYHVTYIVAELPHGSQNAKAAKMMGAVPGILESFNVIENIPVEWYSEADAKKALLGRISASKKEVINAIDSLYEVNWTGTKYIDEAVADALAIYYVAECNSPTIKYINK